MPREGGSGQRHTGIKGERQRSAAGPWERRAGRAVVPLPGAGGGRVCPARSRGEKRRIRAAPGPPETGHCKQEAAAACTYATEATCGCRAAGDRAGKERGSGDRASSAAARWAPGSDPDTAELPAERQKARLGAKC